MRIFRLVTLALAVFALALLCLSGPGTKQGWWDWRIGLIAYQGAAWFGLAAAAAALLLLALLAHPRFRARPWLPVVALCIGLLAATPPLILRARAKSVPPIHDITTDTADPPAFLALREVRDKSPNGSAYAGESIAALQQSAYTDIKPKVLSRAPRDAHQRVIDAARSLGWEVVASDAAAGRVECTDTTRWFGFKDDVVVRVRPEGNGSRVDVRSASRVGRSDIGANAARIRELLDKLG